MRFKWKEQGRERRKSSAQANTEGIIEGVTGLGTGLSTGPYQDLLGTSRLPVLGLGCYTIGSITHVCT